MVEIDPLEGTQIGVAEEPALMFEDSVGVMSSGSHRKRDFIRQHVHLVNAEHAAGRCHADLAYDAFFAAEEMRQSIPIQQGIEVSAPFGQQLLQQSVQFMALGS